jgi:hypothetical protein
MGLAGRGGVIHRVAPLGKGSAIPGETRFVATPSRPAKPINITWTEY